MKKKSEMSISIEKMQQMLHRKEISCATVTTQYLKEIREKDGAIAAYLTVDETALEQAKHLDEAIARGQTIGTLAGVTVALTDNIATEDLPTTCASKMLEGYLPPSDAQVVTQLKNSGAVILGKLNMNEFGVGMATETSCYQQTKNPHDLTKVAGDCGCGAAVASQEAMIAIGSDISGDLRQSAAACGVVGFKPTYGSVSRNGLIACASSLEQIGVCANRVEDVAAVLDVIVGHDAKDTTSFAFDTPSYSECIRKESGAMKVAFPKFFTEQSAQSQIGAAMATAAENFRKMGVAVEEIRMEHWEQVLPAYYILSSAEFSSNMARFDGLCYGHRTAQYSDFDEMYRKSRGEGFGREVKRRIFLGTYALSSGYYDAYYKKAQKVRTLIRNQYTEIFKEYDAVLMPVSPETVPVPGGTEDFTKAYHRNLYTVLANMTGLPALSINCGHDESGMPIGMQLIGKAFGEESLLRLAHHYEQMF